MKFLGSDREASAAPVQRIQGANSKLRHDAVVSIPMQGRATSLNVTSAASILLYEIRRRRIIGGCGPAEVSEGGRCPIRGTGD